MRCVKIENGVVKAERSDTGQLEVPTGWFDIEGRDDRDSIELGSTYDSESDTFSDPPEEEST